MKKIIVIILALFNCHSIYPWNCAGEITYSHLSGNTYEITAKLYVDSFASNIEPFLEIHCGDSTTSILNLNNVSYFSDSSLICKTFTGSHDFNAPGTYNLWFEIPNHSWGIVNIPGSINVPLYLESQIVINPFLGSNNSPDFNTFAINMGFLNNIYTFNPQAIDPDGDSLSYKLVVCKGAGGMPILGYEFPLTSNIFKLDSVTGNLTWDSPIMAGDYNIAYLIEEWRQGIKIGSVTREIQIRISLSNFTDDMNQVEKTVNVYPNPVTDHFTIEYNQYNCKNSIIEMYDITGQQQFKINHINNQDINIERLVKGVYLLRMICENETYTQKIIKY